MQTSSGAHPPSYSVRSGILSQGQSDQGVKLTTNSSPFTTKIKNKWNCTYAAFICLQGMDTDNLVFTKQPNNNDYVSSTILKFSLKSNLPWTCDFLDCLKLYFTLSFSYSQKWKKNSGLKRHH